MENILDIAMSVFAASPVGNPAFHYRVFIGRTIDRYGQATSSYGPWKRSRGMVEPGIVSSFGGKNIEEKDYKDFGLDFSMNNVTIWISAADLHTVCNRESPDQIRYDGKVYNIIQCADWEGHNGWKRCYCQQDKSIEPGVDP